jgi:hypothetical protein
VWYVGVFCRCVSDADGGGKRNIGTLVVRGAWRSSQNFSPLATTSLSMHICNENPTSSLSIVLTRRAISPPSALHTHHNTQRGEERKRAFSSTSIAPPPHIYQRRRRRLSFVRKRGQERRGGFLFSFFFFGGEDNCQQRRGMAPGHQTAAVLRLMSDLKAIKTEPPDVSPRPPTLLTSLFLTRARTSHHERSYRQTPAINAPSS